MCPPWSEPVEGMAASCLCAVEPTGIERHARALGLLETLDAAALIVHTRGTFTWTCALSEGKECFHCILPSNSQQSCEVDAYTHLSLQEENTMDREAVT